MAQHQPTQRAALLCSEQRIDELRVDAEKGTLRIRADITLSMEMFEQFEKHPMVHVWLSEAVSHQVKTITLGRATVTKQHKHTWVLHFDEDFLLAPGASVESIGLSTLNLWAHVARENRTKQLCYIANGFVSIPALHLMDDFQVSQAEAKGRSYDLVIAGLVYAGVTKGKVTVSAPTVAEAGPKAARPSLFFQGSRIFLDPKVSAQAVARLVAVNTANDKAMLQYIGHCISFEDQKARPSFPCLTLIKAHRFVMPNGRVVPMCGFVLYTSPLAKPDYYENLCLNALRREKIDPDTFIAGRCSPADEQTVLGHVAVMPSNYIRYIGDEIVTGFQGLKSMTRPLEAFSHCVRAILAGDCEDTAKLIDNLLTEIRDMPDAYVQHSPLLARLRAVRRCFLSNTILAGVRSGDIGGAYKIDAADAKMGAHLHAFLVPKYLFLEWFAAGHNTAPVQLVSQLHGDTAQALADSHKYTPVLCEGTGYLDPRGAGQSARAPLVRDALQSADADNQAFFGLRPQFVYARDKLAGTNFYMAVVKVFSRELADRGDLRTTFYPTPLCQQGITKGVEFKDFISPKPLIKLSAGPALPAALLPVLKAQMADLEPMQAFESVNDNPDQSLPPLVYSARAEGSGLLRTLRAYAAANVLVRKNITGSEPVTLQWIMDYEQMGVASRAERMLSTLKSASARRDGPRLVAASIVEEPLHRGFGGALMELTFC